MNHFEVFSLSFAKARVKDAVQELQKQGIEVTATLEEEGKTKIFILIDPKMLPSLSFAEKLQLEEVNWQQQWQDNSRGYHDGYAHIAVDGRVIKLKAGPGFGDASHPTTCLMLKELESLVEGRVIFDVGCGSGILSLAAIAAGADFAYGFDIDEEAITHARCNSVLNAMEDQTLFSSVDHFKAPICEAPPLILINMISSEQKAAQKCLKTLGIEAKEWLCSGIRDNEREAYLKDMAANWRLKPLGEESQDGWLCIHFSL